MSNLATHLTKLESVIVSTLIDDEAMATTIDILPGGEGGHSISNEVQEGRLKSACQSPVCQVEEEIMLQLRCVVHVKVGLVKDSVAEDHKAAE